MKTVTSVSGGRTSAYLAANYPTDYNVFALVRIEDEKCRFPDEKIRREVEDRIQAPFIGTAEDDKIIYTMLDLEQYLGRKIIWVTGITFDEVVRDKGGWLPNMLHRYCTQWMKLTPMFYWWAKELGEPVEMRIGFRANEIKRANKMNKKLNVHGLLEFEATFEKHTEGKNTGQNKWVAVEWQKPSFPLIKDKIFKDHILNYWKDKSVRFAPLNNCVGCFHRHPLLLKKMWVEHPQKMEWFAEKEGGNKAYWGDPELPYYAIKKLKDSLLLDYSDFGSCDSGYCEVG
jgi:hypothetical protein